jgi:hypothetical protein
MGQQVNIRCEWWWVVSKKKGFLLGNDKGKTGVVTEQLNY